ncbi:GNAT family N-acetyltransferase [Roseospira marina]|uniref:GNAT family N-acetyltransferase n=1 Tax=Roseospira marina TaxID=140057 RepID=A0A5M6ICU2_9PROT|nr:GNAT family N-acetyltransferase [Roseospira marina]KAA5605555.1 GNAT family N-acetyltransferase [Roseospira marina]MBB4313384.1 GNAT superfamily N-acetyltransferase [Roseospira marina]MBB5085875.1 GNAT superfamily N-acetyltransferase [Roseospira marina]
MPDPTAQSLTVRNARPDDEASWRVLWGGYCAFYNVEIPEAVTAETWRRLLDPNVPTLRCIVADSQGPEGKGLVGFATLLEHPGTWSIESVGYLEDLFVASGVRKRGAGTALISACAAIARNAGWAKLYWRTKADNTAARSLYDRLAMKTDWVVYDWALKT